MHRTANLVAHARAGFRQVRQHHPPVCRVRLPTY
jgi:hypothetical protein